MSVLLLMYGIYMPVADVVHPLNSLASLVTATHLSAVLKHVPVIVYKFALFLLPKVIFHFKMWHSLK